MTKKDYELIAKAFNGYVTTEYEIRKSLDEMNDNGHKVNRTANEARIYQLAELVGYLSASLSRENEKFDNRKFEIACGFINN